MPKIPQYTSRISSPGAVDLPRANVDTMGGQLGRGIEKFGNAVMDFADSQMKAENQAEISRLNVFAAESGVELSKKLRQKHDSGDLEADENGSYKLSENFKSEMEDRFEEQRSTIKTRAGQLHFNELSAKMKANFEMQALEVQSSLAGSKAKSDFLQSHTKRSSMVVNDPANFQMALELTKADVESRVATGQLPRQAADKLLADSKIDIAQNTVRGWNKIDPAYAKKLLDEGKLDEYVGGDMKHQLYGEINTQERANRTQESLNRQEEKRIKQEADNKLKDDIYVDLQRGKFAGMKDRILNSNLDMPEKKQMIDILKSESEGKIKINHGVFQSLFDRIHAPDSDPKKIKSDKELDQYVGSLGIDGLNKLRKEFRGLNTEEGRNTAQLKNQFLNTVKNKLVTSDAFGNKDPQGQESYTNFLSVFQEAYQKGIESGKTPQQLLQSDSPDFLGKLATPFYKTPMQIMRENVQRLRPVPTVTPSPTQIPARKPGESPADFIKRTKK